jgi:oligoendopeptidase F
MKKQNYTVLKMFKMSDEFFTSLGMHPMTKSFWKNSILEKPEGREVVCHASAWDFCDGEDVRIKMCTVVDMDRFIVVHHEMGHIQYFLQYAKQPDLFQDGANPGFHEAVGDTISLSVCTPEHMQAVGLLDKNTVIDEETDLNFLFKMASDKVAFLPFGYLIDKWRWDVFNGTVTPDLYNKRWWQLKNEIQGVAPPQPRGDDLFDAGPKYHIPASVAYIRYFVSHILQFQFHKALCIKAGQYDPNNGTSRPLHRCDIYNSKEAGKLFSEVLSLGSSKPWNEALELVTGSQKMDAGPLMEYFRPLYTFLQRENAGHKINWS